LEAAIPTILDPSLAPPGKHLMLVNVPYTPYHLREGNWDDRREELGRRVVEHLEACAPGFTRLVIDSRSWTPLDFERDFGLTEGSFSHGEMSLDQYLFMRPIPGYSGYRAPVGGLYLCGAGTHPGGGVSGAPGYNAARIVLQDLGTTVS
jgi:phytoene dehydrogenase-like protein